jgi:hypothetical protein
MIFCRDISILSASTNKKCYIGSTINHMEVGQVSFESL